MNGWLNELARWAMLAFLLAGMLELGLGLTFREVLAPLRKARLVVPALLANFVAGPLLAFGLARALRLEPPFAIGLLLLGLAPGAPFIPKVVQLARGDVPMAVGLMVLLMVGTVVVLPIALPRLIPGAAVGAWPIAKPLLLLMLLPLLAGLSIPARFRGRPAWLRPALGAVANGSALVVLAAILALHGRSVASVFGTGAILAGALFIALCTLAGWLPGGPDPAVRRALGLGAGLRNVAAALLVGAQNFKDPGVNVMVIVTALVGLLLVLPMARRLGQSPRPATEPHPQP